MLMLIILLSGSSKNINPNNPIKYAKHNLDVQLKGQASTVSTSDDQCHNNDCKSIHL